MLVHTVFQRTYRMKYQQSEDVDHPSQIRHPILRESLLRHWRGDPLEIASVADVPASTGLGSSGAFTVCLLKALAHARSTSIAADTSGGGRLRDRNRHLEGTGREAGSVCCCARRHLRVYVQRATGPSRVEPLELKEDTLRRLRNNLLLFYTGEARSGSELLRDQDTRSRRCDDSMLENLHATKRMGYRSRELLLAGDLEAYAELMHEHWENKRTRSPGMTSERIDMLYTLARRSGVIGGKLVGAGGGGFLACLREQSVRYSASDGRRRRTGTRF